MNTRSRATLLATTCAALLCAGQAAADGTGPDYGYAAPRVGPSTVITDTDLLQVDADGVSLKPGEFTWLPGAQADSGAPVTMLVSLRDQRGYLYRDGRRIAVTTVSTGTRGHDTPTGVFPIMFKKQMHHSRKYDNAPMPWMQMLTQWGHALHAGHVRAGPASHGCVRLPAEFAKQLYSLTRPGDLVVISDEVSARALARAGADQATAWLVGITETLPPVIRLKPGQEYTRGMAVEAAGAGMTAF